MHTQRFQKLIDHTRKVQEELFDFSVVAVDRPAACGTIGCVMGHASECFPDLIVRKECPEEPDSFNVHYDLVYIGEGKHNTGDYAEIASELLDLNMDITSALFTPGQALTNGMLPPSMREWARKQDNLQSPDIASTPVEAANFLQAFLDAATSGEIDVHEEYTRKAYVNAY